MQSAAASGLSALRHNRLIGFSPIDSGGANRRSHPAMHKGWQAQLCQEPPLVAAGMGTFSKSKSAWK